MKTRVAQGIALALTVLGLGVTTYAGKPGGIPAVIVVSMVAGDGQVLADPTIPHYRLQSDGLGDYIDGVDNVLSILQGGTVGKGAGDWEMHTLDSAVRKMSIDLREPVDATANPPFQYDTLPSRFILKCHLVSAPSLGGMRGLNSTLVCPLIFSFFIGRDKYVLSMNRGGHPDTNDALVTCTEVSGDPADPNAPCTGWTIDPSVTDATGPVNVARLVTSARGKTLDLGRFYLRFHINVRE